MPDPERVKRGKEGQRRAVAARARSSWRREYLKAEYIRQLRQEKLYTESEIQQRASCYDGDCHGGGRGLRFEDVAKRKMSAEWLRQQSDSIINSRQRVEFDLHSEPHKRPKDKSMIGRAT